MPLGRRPLALLVALAHVAVVAAPCAAAAATDAPGHRAEQSPSSPPHCAEHADRVPPDVAGICPCGCGDAAAPGGVASGPGLALLRDPPAPPARGITRAPGDAPARLPLAPARTPDPVPI